MTTKYTIFLPVQPVQLCILPVQRTGLWMSLWEAQPRLINNVCFTSVSSQHGALDALCELYYEFHMHNIMYVIRPIILYFRIQMHGTLAIENCVYNVLLFLFIVQLSRWLFRSWSCKGTQPVNRRWDTAVRDMDTFPSSISQCIRSHVVLFDMKMCYLTWAGLAAAHTNLHEENLHHFVNDS